MVRKSKETQVPVVVEDVDEEFKVVFEERTVRANGVIAVRRTLIGTPSAQRAWDSVLGPGMRTKPVRYGEDNKPIN